MHQHSRPMSLVLFDFLRKYSTMLPAPIGNARLRPGDRLWVDLTLSSEESGHSDDAADQNDRRRILARADNNNAQPQRDIPPQVDINPYAPADWNPNPVPPRVIPHRADPPPTPPPQAQHQNHQDLLARIQALQQRFTALAAANQNPANTNANIPQSGQSTGQPVRVQTLADLITQQQPARKR